MSAASRGAAAMLAVSLVVVGGGVAGVSASAGTPGSYPGNGDYVGGKVLQPGPEPLVLWKAPGTNGRLGTCITAGANGPLHGPFTVASTVKDSVYAELNYLYARSSTSDVQLAELSALNSHEYDQNDKDVQWGYLRNGAGGTSVADADAMLAHAQHLAGPYTVAIEGLVQHGRGDRAGRTYTATVHVISADRSNVPGQVVTLSASGADLNQRTVTTDKAGNARFSYSVPTSSTTGSFVINYSTDEHLRLDRLSSVGEQTLLSTGTPSATGGGASGGVDPAISIRWFKYTTGDPKRTAVAGAVFSTVVDVTAHRTIARNLISAATPSRLNNVTPGHTLVWTEIKAPKGDYFIGPITTVVPAKATDGYAIGLANPKTPTPTITTSVALSRTRTGVALVDRAVLAGDDHEAGSITDRLYSVPVPTSGTCTTVTDAQYRAGTLVGTYTAAVAPGNGHDGNGTYLITGPTPTTAGCFHWFESVLLRPSGATAVGAPNSTTETTLVTVPAAHTVASAQKAFIGASVFDTITVTGVTQTPAASSLATAGSSGAVLVGTYFLPAQAPAVACSSITPARWAAYIAAGTATQVATDTLPIARDGVLHSRGYRLTALGCVTWQESYQPPGAAPPIVISRPGTPHETTTVVTRITTTTTSAGGPPVLVSAGYAGTGTGPDWAGVTGGLALIAAGLVLGAGLALRRRRGHRTAAGTTTAA